MEISRFFSLSPTSRFLWSHIRRCVEHLPGLEDTFQVFVASKRRLSTFCPTVCQSLYRMHLAARLFLGLEQKIVSYIFNDRYVCMYTTANYIYKVCKFSKIDNYKFYLQNIKIYEAAIGTNLSIYG
jgi:hypothetical protein